MKISKMEFIFHSNSNEQLNENSKTNILHDLHVSKQFEEFVDKILCHAKKTKSRRILCRISSGIKFPNGTYLGSEYGSRLISTNLRFLAKLHLLQDLEYCVLKNIFHDDHIYEKLVNVGYIVQV